MLDEKKSEILWEKRPTNTMPIKFAGANHGRINPQEPGAGGLEHTALQPHSATKIQNVLGRKRGKMNSPAITE